MSVSFNKSFATALPAVALILLAGCAMKSPRSATPPAEPVAADVRGGNAGARAADARAGNAEAEGQVPAGLSPAELIPPEAAAAFARALAAIDQQRWQDAEAELEALTRLYPAYAGPFVNLAILYRRDGRGDEAEAALAQALAIAPEHPAANNQLGIALRERGEFAAAEDAYRRALAGEPDYALAHFNLGVLLDLYMGRRNEALEHYERYQVLAAEPDPQVGVWIADLRRRLGVTEQAQLAREAAR